MARTGANRAYIYALGGNTKTVNIIAKSQDTNGWITGLLECAGEAGTPALVQDKAPGQGDVVSLDEAEALLMGSGFERRRTRLVAITHLRLMQAKKVSDQSCANLRNIICSAGLLACN